MAGQAIEPVCERSTQTRLGHGFYQTHCLRAEAITATARAVAEFAAAARGMQAVAIRVFATSATREAANREELTAAIEQASGLRVEVISGEQEADWGFQGVTTDPEFRQGLLLLLDVGGGSTQLAFGRAGHKPFHQSFPLGTVRLSETIPCSDPPTPGQFSSCRKWLRDFLQQEVRPQFGVDRRVDQGLVSLAAPGSGEGSPETEAMRAAPLHRGETCDIQPPTSNIQWAPAGQSLDAGCSRVSWKDVKLVGVGGTGTILGCMEAGLKSFDRARIEGIRLSVARVAWHLERVWSLPLEQRKNISGLPRNRADVILMGVAIYHAVMEEFRFAELRISTRGLRFAALLREKSE